MKKSLILLVLAFVLTVSIFTLASCGEETPDTTTTEETTIPLQGEDAKAAYEWVDEQMSALRGFDVVMEMTSDGVTETVEMKVDASSDEVKFALKTDMEGIGMDVIYIDGVAYMAMTMEGMTVKMKTSDEETVAPFKTMVDIFDAEEEEEDEDVVAYASFVSRENGKYVIKAIMDEATAKKDALDELGVESEADLMGSVITEATSSVTYECDENGMVSKVIKEVSFKLDGEATTISGVMTLTNPGTIPTITAPADADQYVDQDAMVG